MTFEMTTYYRIKNKEWNEGQRNFYNSRDHKRMWHSARSAFIDNILKKMISFVHLPPTARILEIGCGAGRYTIPLIQAGYHITGIDISERMLRQLETTAQDLNLPQDRYRLICGDFDTFRLESEEPFDAVIGFNVLHHLYDLVKCFQKMGAYVKKDGLVVFLEPNALNPLHTIDSILDRGWKAEGRKFHSIPEKIRVAMEVNGFHKVAYERFGFFPPPLIDAWPSLMEIEQQLERYSWLNKILPYFIIKGTLKCCHSRESGNP